MSILRALFIQGTNTLSKSMHFYVFTDSTKNATQCKIFLKIFQIYLFCASEVLLVNVLCAWKFEERRDFELFRIHQTKCFCGCRKCHHVHFLLEYLSNFIFACLETGYFLDGERESKIYGNVSLFEGKSAFAWLAQFLRSRFKVGHEKQSCISKCFGVGRVVPFTSFIRNFSLRLT